MFVLIVKSAVDHGDLHAALHHRSSENEIETDAALALEILINFALLLEVSLKIMAHGFAYFRCVDRR